MSPPLKWNTKLQVFQIMLTNDRNLWTPVFGNCLPGFRCGKWLNRLRHSYFSSDQTACFEWYGTSAYVIIIALLSIGYSQHKKAGLLVSTYRKWDQNVLVSTRPWQPITLARVVPHSSCVWFPNHTLQCLRLPHVLSHRLPWSQDQNSHVFLSKPLMWHE